MRLRHTAKRIALDESGSPGCSTDCAVTDSYLLLSVPSVGTLALTSEQVTEARRRASEVLPPASNTAAGAAPKGDGSPALLDTVQMASLTGVPASWLETAARKGLIPSHEFGRWRRFAYAEVLEASRAGKIPRLKDIPPAPVLLDAQRIKRRKS